MIERKTSVFIPDLFMFLYNIQAIREYLWTIYKKVVKSGSTNCGFNYQRPYSTLNISCIDNCIYFTPKHFFRIVLVSQIIVLQFHKEVSTQLGLFGSDVYIYDIWYIHIYILYIIYICYIIYNIYTYIHVYE